MTPILPSTPRAATPELPDLPPLARYLIGHFFQPILAWLETLLLRHLLFRCIDHPLVQLALHYDPAPVVAACADYYHLPGAKGATPTYSVELLVRAEIVRSWAASCSDRDLECLLLSNLLVRFSSVCACSTRFPTIPRWRAFTTGSATTIPTRCSAMC